MGLTLCRQNQREVPVLHKAYTSSLATQNHLRFIEAEARPIHKYSRYASRHGSAYAHAVLTPYQPTACPRAHVNYHEIWW
jgi:hypothetical protein